MDDQNQNKCLKCGKAKEAKQVGSITQWISSCACSLEVPESASEKHTNCEVCGKRISEAKEGRITQWLFAENICSCNSPQALNKKGSKPLYKTAYGKLVSEEELQSEEEIEVPKDFPKERYKPLKELGSGASGSVYLCRDRLLKKLVSLKILHVLNPEQLIAFQQEAKSTSKLKHPNIVEILDFGSTPEGAPYMVLEWFDGQSLKDYIIKNGNLSSVRTLQIFSKITEALQHAHEQSIFHRDLKPSNILISKDLEDNPEVLLIDLGVAYVKEQSLEPTLFQGKTIVGTPYYMSPDLGLGKKYDERSEIYSLGCTMFECLQGSPPFFGDTAMEVLSKHANHPVPEIHLESNSSIDKSLTAVVKKCLSKSPQDRYQSMQALNAAIEATLAKEKNLSNLKATDSFGLKPKRKRLRLSVVIVPALSFVLVGLFLVKTRNPDLSTKRVKKSQKLDQDLSAIPSGMIPWTKQMHDSNLVFTKTTRNGNLSIKPQYFEISNQDVHALIKEEKIYSLDLSNSLVNGDNLDLLKDKNIIVLKMRYCTISEKGFANIGKLTSLQRINIRDSTATGQLSNFQNLKNLRSLDLSNTKVEDKDLLDLTDLSKLKSINLAYNLNVKGKSLEALSNLKYLSSLKLQYSGVEDKYLLDTNWNKFPNLVVLHLNGCKNVSTKTIDYLSKKYPHLKLQKLKKNKMEEPLKELGKFHKVRVIPR